MMRELAPLVQSSQLMQVKKQDEKDADNLLSMCDSLTGAQVNFLTKMFKFFRFCFQTFSLFLINFNCCRF